MVKAGISSKHSRYKEKYIISVDPMPKEPPKFFQINFIGDVDGQVNIRCENNHINRINERFIVSTFIT